MQTKQTQEVTTGVLDPLIVKGIVVKTGAMFALVSILTEDGGQPRKFVAIRKESHQTMKIACRLAHGVIFTGSVVQREPKFSDSVYIQIIDFEAREAIAWACTDENVVVRPPVIHVPTKSPKKRPFAVKLVERRLKEDDIRAEVVPVLV